jgi:hypothetical protein
MKSKAFLGGRMVAVLSALLLLVALEGLSTPQTVALGDDPPEQLLPDLRTLPPRDIEIVVSRRGPKGERRLRFDNRIWNAGTGPVEAAPLSQDCDGDGDTRNDRLAVQRIYLDTMDDDAFDRSSDADFDTHEMGCMEFHARHHHWHIEDFARYDLHAIGADGTVTGAALRSSEKVSFCMIDTFDESAAVLPGEPSSPYYRQCARDAVYGISIGWGDEYQSTLADQWIVINGVADGAYCLVSTANPLGLFVESDTTNNVAGVRITISGNTVTPRNPGQPCAAGG